ncbi:hypothetical protein BS47DRAFT_1357487 [Hydnum rufescens UP504]|uniref:Uncharacterized protein n=1 Tax=Hydnum rufescens UP504 TaxID=1448309 RepID=A0A9P6B9T8_9AGAM|nr:hypothetical protein BS47DRAFT_1357487 [Hydnum rufescens UP504]
MSHLAPVLHPRSTVLVLLPILVLGLRSHPCSAYSPVSHTVPSLHPILPAISHRSPRRNCTTPKDTHRSPPISAPAPQYRNPTHPPPISILALEPLFDPAPRTASHPPLPSRLPFPEIGLRTHSLKSRMRTSAIRYKQEPSPRRGVNPFFTPSPGRASRMYWWDQPSGFTSVGVMGARCVVEREEADIGENSAVLSREGASSHTARTGTYSSRKAGSFAAIGVSRSWWLCVRPGWPGSRISGPAAA